MEDVLELEIESWLRARAAEALRVPGEEIDPGRPLIDQGLDSLGAIELGQAVETALGVALPPGMLLEGASLRDLTPLTPLSHRPPAIRERGEEGRTDRASLSVTQRGLWFLHRLHPESTAYHLSTMVRVSGEGSNEDLRAVFQAMVDCHPALRTTFPLVGDEPVQVIPAQGEVPFEVIDAAGWSDAEVRAAMEEAAFRPFDLERGPIFRVSLFDRGLFNQKTERLLVVAMHHIVSDFGALVNLLQEAPREGAKGFAQFVAWQEEMLAGPEGERLEAFWRERLAGLPELDLPADRVKPANAPEQGDASWREVGPETLARLKALARSRGATLYVVLLSAFQALLHRYTGQEDFAVGSPVAGRPTGYGRVVGYFTNPVVLRADLAGDPPFRELVDRARRRVVEALDHQHFPLPLLVERLRARAELFRALFVLHRAPVEAQGLVSFSLGEGGGRIGLGGFELESLPLAQRAAQFDLTLAAGERRGALGLQIIYDAARFEATTIARWLQHLDNLVTGAAEKPDTPLSDLPLLSPWETQQLLREVNDGSDAGDGDLPWTTLHEGFERQAGRTPAATALIDGDRRLTYQELNARAEELAGTLRKLGAGPETVVAVKLPRTAELIVALLGVLKAGAAYLPLDPGYPEERIGFMVEDAGATLEISSTNLHPSPARGRGAGGEGSGEGALAYLIYTSGSTGRPKGVAIEHAAAVRLVTWAGQAFSAEELRGVLAATSVNFDLSIFEIFVPLSLGGTVILAENALALPRLPARDEVTLINTVPSAVAGLLELGPLPASVRTVNLAGEPLRRSLADQVLAAGVKLWDLYGPSEDTTYSTGAVVEAGDPSEPLIGWPVAGSRAYVLGRLEQGFRPLPLGVPGELCLGGGGLARGYLGRPALTAEKFVPSPFGDAPGERLYRTGDLVRRRFDGALEYLGRIDHQVKIRGFRIELGEVEAALLAVPEVREVVVVAREGSLVAYVSLDSGMPEEALREALLDRLPAPFVPSFFVVLDALPRTPNGKVDRKALPAPEVPAASSVEAPVGPVEEALAAVWAGVLGREGVGRSESFFELGGHSLLAARVMARVREALGVDLPLTALFDAPTVAGLAARVAAAQASSERPLQPVPRDRPLPLSFAQQRLWFLDRLEPGSPLYNIPLALRAAGPLGLARLERALTEIERRHEALRTVFPLRAGIPVQEIRPPAPFVLPVVDLSGLPPAVRTPASAALIAAEARRPFDLERGPVWRALCLRLDALEHAALLTVHHVAGDAWSLEILEREVRALYGGGSLPALPVQSADFAVWQRERLDGAALRRDLAWWRERLAGAEPLDLPGDRPRPASPTSRGFHLTAPLPAGLAAELGACARGRDATLYQLLLAGFAAFLARWSGQRDLSIGAPVAGRGRIEVEGLIGVFVNTLVLRLDLGDDPSLAVLLGRTREVALAAQAHGEMPFERLVEELVPERTSGRAPLVQTMFDLDHARPPRELAPGVLLERLSVETGTAKLDLSLSVEEADGALTATLEASADLFDRTTGRRLLDAWLRLLAAAVREPDLPLSRLPLLDAAEEAQVVREWNDTAAEPPRDLDLGSLFDRQVRERPEAPALVWGEARRTYGELAAEVAPLALRLRALGVGLDVPVAFCLERGIGRIVALLAILKAGGAYVPLDPAAPAERLAWILEDCGAPVVITEEGLRGRLGECQGVVLLLDQGEDSKDSKDTGDEETKPLSFFGSLASLKSPALPSSAAYVLYTSGSTGRPKGVVVEHRSAATYAQTLAGELGLGPDDRALQLASIGFDLSVEEIFGTFAAGAALYLAPADLGLSAAACLERCRQWGLTVLSLPTALWHEIVREIAGRPAALPPSLRRITIGGETALPERAAEWWRHAGPAIERDLRLFNTYGPTEITVAATRTLLAEGTLGGPFGVPIGRPFRQVQAYVLDRGLRPVAPGLPGEICIGGAGVGRGYLRRPDLTAERFVPDPFAETPGARLYRTGDRGRFRADGQLEFLGRFDDQVKIRGFRIEPGEIEAVLTLCPGVAEAAVVAQADARGELRLAAFVVPAASEPAPGEMRGFLRRRLPEYMVPSAFHFLAALPLTPSGKVDRRALARLQPSAGGGAEGAVLVPMDPVEEMVASVWAEILEIPAGRIGLRDSFFALGGHSLLATRIGSRLREELGVEVSLRELMEEPTVEGLARRVRGLLGYAAAGSAPPPLVPLPQTSPPPLSFAQLRLWIIDRLTPGTPAYNVPLAVRLEGALDPGLLARAFSEVARRHEAVRTTFGALGDEPVQIVHPPAPVPLRLADLESLPEAAREGEARRLAGEEEVLPFDLECGPVLRAGLLRLAREEHVLLLTLHHIACDEWSIRLLFREVVTLYAAWRAGRTAALPALPVQYVDFAVWQRRWLTGETLESQLAFWRSRLGNPPVLELPADRPRPPLQTFRGARVSFTLPAEASQALLALGRRRGATAFMTLLAAFEALLARTAQQTDLTVGTPITGRTRIEVESLIGFFLNTLVLRADLSGDPGFGEIVDRTRARALEAYAHQDLPFEKLVDEMGVVRSLGHSPLFQALFVLLHAMPQPTEAAGLRATPFEGEGATAKFDLTLAMEVDGEAVTGVIEYNADLFDRTTALRMAERFRILCAGAARDPELPLSSLPVLPESEAHQILRELNDRPPLHPHVRLDELVAAWAEREPERVAVEWNGGSWSYGDLVAGARALAVRLGELGVGPDVPVGVYAGRGPELAVALLAVFAAGGAYLPIDPSYPRERQAFMLADSGAPVLLVPEGLADEVPETAARVVTLSPSPPGPLSHPLPPGQERGNVFEAAEASILPESVGETSPLSRGMGGDGRGAGGEGTAYVIYTSGSTGRPKGVAVPHRVLANLISWQIDPDRPGAMPGPWRTLQFSSPSFDVSLQEILSTWCAGGTLVLAADDDRRDPERLARLLAEAEVERIFLPFVALRQLAEELARPGSPVPARLRRVVTAGEQLQVTPQVAEAFRRLSAATGGTALHNQYGPSETHVVTELVLEGDPAEWPAVPSIGRPVAGTTAYILDAALVPVPIGVAGELALGGLSPARGYLGRPDQAAEKFIPDAWSEVPGARLYRSGDLARFLPDGRIEFLGRVDHQVKIRGYRVEPGEVEALLALHPRVRECAVAVREDRPGDRRLVAWVVADGEVAASDLREHLRGRLPDPMIPAAFVKLEALPLTPSGKADRRTLARLPMAEETLDRTHPVVPQDPVAEMVAAVWAEILGIATERIGPHDDFFALGGHSLLATRIGSRLRQAFGVEVPLRVILERPTVEALAGHVREALGGGSARPVAPPLVRRPPGSAEPPLSFAQLRLWIIDRIEPGSTTYNVALAVRLEGGLEPALLAQALGAVARRHEAVRTTFGVRGGEPVQIVHPPAPVPVPVADLTVLPETLRAHEARRLAHVEETRPFDLERGPVLRAGLVRLAEQEHLLLLTLHHIVCDEWSLRLLFHEVVTLYAALRAGRPAALPELPVQYADFAVWQRGWLTGEVLEAQLAFWRQRLADPPVLELPTDRPRPPVQTVRGARLSFALPAETSAALLALGRRRGATAFMTLLAAWQALLSRTAGQTDLTVGTPITGRTRVEVESLIGFFLNTLVLRADLSGDPGFGEIVDRARARSLEAYAHQDLPFEKLVDEVGVRRSLGHSPLFQALFVLLHATPLPDGATGLSAAPFATEGATSKFDLTLAMEANGELLAGVIEFNTDLFDRTTALRLAERFRVLCAAAAREPRRPLADLPVLPASEAHQITREWNDRPPLHPEVRLHDLVAAWAAREPERIAVEWEGGAWTYAELVGRARALAARLRGLGVGPNVPVGVFAGRGPELSVALLAVLESGGAYLPIDPDYPRERQVFMLEDSGAPVLMVPESLAESAPVTGARVVTLTPGPSPASGVGEPKKDPSGPGEEGSYVIYTSGSTGRPKGIAVPHRVLANLVLWQIDPARPGAMPGPFRTLQFSSPSFDVSLQEILSTWCTGGTLVLASEEDRRDPERLARHLAEAEVERLFLPFVALQQLADRLARPESPVPARLRRVITAGEQLQVTPQVAEAFRRLSEATGGTALHNHYGPSETHVITELVLEGDPARWPAVPSIGRPIAGTSAHVLDRTWQPVPLGVHGELALGGLAPARGYLGRPDQTAEKFIPDPWSGEPGARLYRSGDLVHLLPDGNIEFLGRIDHQVKIRGYRVEPGEIEALLAAHPRVRECAVAVREDRPGDRRLVAWVVTDGDVAPAELRDHLRARLPDPMVPSAFVKLDAMPLTATGKIQRSALPAPEGERLAAAPYVEPGTALEREIAAVFRDELELGRVGREDNFFDLGGHSLTMIRAASRLTERLGRPVAVLDLFRTPTVASLARQLGGGEEALPARETLEERAATRRQSLGRRRELRRR